MKEDDCPAPEAPACSTMKPMSASGWDGGVGEDRHACRLKDQKRERGWGHATRYKVHVSTVTLQCPS